MKPRELTTILSQLHGRPSCGGLSQAGSERVWEKVSKAIAASPSPRVSMWARAMVLPRLFADAVARPAMIGTLILALAMGGWIGGVNASLSTLPGDTLYGVKLVSEKAQLSLASDSSRPKLQAEFASRRVREVAEIVKRVESPSVKKEKVRVAVNGFKKHIADLQQGAVAQPEENAVEVARLVEQKEGELKDVLETVQKEEVAEGVASVNDTAVSGTIGEAVHAVGEAKDAVVETLVIRTEESAKTAPQESTPSSEELERQIRNALREVSTDSQMLLTRIDRVERALAAVIARSGSDEAISASVATELRADVFDVRRTRYSVRSQAKPMSEAMDIAARGSYREALARIATITQELDKVKTTLTDAEIKLVQLAQQEQREPREERTEKEEIIKDANTENEKPAPPTETP